MPNRQHRQRNAWWQLPQPLGMLLWLLPLLVCHPSLLAQPSTTSGSHQIIVLRHAEKGVDDPADPTLSPAGMKRAEALVMALTNAGVGAIITSHLKRTQLTAAPLAARLGVTPVVLTVKRGETAAHIADVVATVNTARSAQKGAILVVGHSNTVPLIVKALSGIDVANICDSQHANLFLLFISTATATATAAAHQALGPTPESTARLIKSKYGEADPPANADCK
ncbi:MAG: histidine phosphatase family protein [Aeromicrobium sp.]|nr:histidine phosphatase family protein [Burkholderiales bacterium]